MAHEGAGMRSDFWRQKNTTKMLHSRRLSKVRKCFEMGLRRGVRSDAQLSSTETRYIFLQRLIILLTDPILSHSPNFGRPKQGQKFVVPTFHIHILNPECVRIPWVLAPKNFHVQNFRVRSVLQKSSIFH